MELLSVLQSVLPYCGARDVIIVTLTLGISKQRQQKHIECLHSWTLRIIPNHIKFFNGYMSNKYNSLMDVQHRGVCVGAVVGGFVQLFRGSLGINGRIQLQVSSPSCLTFAIF